MRSNLHNFFLYLSLSLHSLLWLQRCYAHDMTPFLSVSCLPPGGMDAKVHRKTHLYLPVHNLTTAISTQRGLHNINL